MTKLPRPWWKSTALLHASNASCSVEDGRNPKSEDARDTAHKGIRQGDGVPEEAMREADFE